MFDLKIINGRIVDGSGEDAFVGDVAIKDGKIAAIGKDLGPAQREVNAAGALVTPGFVDVHTHYDGQVTWDPELTPSSWHGVTTVVMGNCGVGFAPARPTERAFMVRVMEGVEEIPGAALEEGMSWNWETFPEYLDELERMPRAIDVAAQVPHCALRCYVMGEERALDDEATADDIEQMARLTEEALKAGAVGFSTSRTMLHRIKGGGVVPGTHCSPQELVGIAEGVRGAGHGVFQMISDHMGAEPDFSWMKKIAGMTGKPLAFTLADSLKQPGAYREVLEALRQAKENDNIDIRASVPWRPPGVLLGLQATLNPFLMHPSFARLRGLPLEEMVAQMREPAFKAQLLSEETQAKDPFLRHLLGRFSNMFALGDPPDYEPPQEDCLAARAERDGRSAAELAYEVLLQNDGRQFIYFPLANYNQYDFSAIHEMMAHPNASASLSDGGAHVGSISDASFTTYMLTHWARDRHRGPKFRLEDVIKKQTHETADLYGFEDRGLLAVGKRADINIIDFDHLRLHAPYMAFDLPTGGKRLLQKADGFRATFVAGEMIAENGEMTGARPGKLVRGPQLN